MDGRLRVTLKDLQTSVEKVIRDKEVSETAVILWAKEVNKDSIFDKETCAMPGSILLGLEWVEDGEIEHGTLRIEPPLVVSRLN